MFLITQNLCVTTLYIVQIFYSKLKKKIWTCLKFKTAYAVKDCTCVPYNKITVILMSNLVHVFRNFNMIPELNMKNASATLKYLNLIWIFERRYEDCFLWYAISPSLRRTTKNTHRNDALRRYIKSYKEYCEVFSSLELSAQVSFSDCLLSVHLSVNFSHSHLKFLSKTTGPFLTKHGTKFILVKGNKIWSNEGPHIQLTISNI